MNDYLSPIILTFWNGIFHSIILIIFLPILFLTRLINFGKIQFDIKTFIFWLLIKICFIIICFARQLMIFQVINKYNPAYMIFMISIDSFISFISRLFLKEKEESSYNMSVWYIIFDCIPLILLSFGGLLFNEIIIIHKFGLDKKTRFSLKILADEEILASELKDEYN